MSAPSQPPMPPSQPPLSPSETPTLNDSERLKELLDQMKATNPAANTDLIQRAFQFSANLHKDQKRRSGEQYIHHPLEVARILAELKLDAVTIATGLLHDTVEDTQTSLAEIETEFGPEIATLVDGVTKIGKISFRTSEEKQAENFRKMILAMAKDLRVILVKLADRTHNMRTLQFLKPDKQVAIAQETLEIYCPLANRLGLSSMKRELEDLALRYTKPEIYYKLVASVAKKVKEREQYTRDVQTLIEQTLKEHGNKDAEVSGRPKHFYSIHKKMEKRGLSYDQVFDITGFRIVVKSIEQCYGILGLIHSLWTPVPGRFKDYIAIPKANFYQSLHTTVVGPGGEKIEIQIRTREMHDTAERGIAAHWAYKEGQPNTSQQFTWLNRLLESQKDLADPNEFLETVKLDLFAEEVFVFTPKGKVLAFPQGATPLDFAYAVHTDLGHHCIGAKVNNRMVPLKHRLKSGDTVDIITSPNQRPNKDWLKIVKTSRAKSKIRQYIKVEEYERSLALGEMIVEKELKKAGSGLVLKQLLKDGSLQKIAESFSLKTTADLFSAVGYGKISSSKVLTRILPKTDLLQPKEVKEAPASGLQQIFESARNKKKADQVVKVRGVEDLLVRFARCCSPVPGDAVIGFITRGRGISVHSQKCPKILDSDPHRLIDIEWDDSKSQTRKAAVRIVCEDRPGLLAEMTARIKDLDVNITRAQIGTTKDKKALCLISLAISDLKHLRTVISALEGVPGVISVERVQKKTS